ncbi:uncharacterized protein HD556DRAFT_478845 [Suillus plorans]|uniref:F-box domain-containing protein n=1 Tax=Suillus plorans TaxID=116603 RepID=A0A9P7DWH9_9AGAM|nr:uncharacterized protein HD556DRAFT_478845 [Suillus plorans]KAG1804771.1 hypothetical protein HD556DRAFT_478845 [Suillus plorans]
MPQIFYHCLPESDHQLPSELRAPLLLTGACRRWREVAVDMPSLWSTKFLIRQVIPAKHCRPAVKGRGMLRLSWPNPSIEPRCYRHPCVYLASSMGNWPLLDGPTSPCVPRVRALTLAHAILHGILIHDRSRFPKHNTHCYIFSLKKIEVDLVPWATYQCWRLLLCI